MRRNIRSRFGAMWSALVTSGQWTTTLVKEPWYFALDSFEYKVFKLILNLTDSKNLTLRDVT